MFQAVQQPSSPIVVDVIKQPPITPEIGMADVVLGAVGLTGLIMIAALIAGLLIGLGFVFFKKMRERSDKTGPGHATLRI